MRLRFAVFESNAVSLAIYQKVVDQKQQELTFYTDAQRDQALRSFESIKPFLEDGIPLTTLSSRSKMALRTLRRRVKNYREHGLIGLIRYKRSKKAPSRCALEPIVEGLLLRLPDRSISSIWREVLRIADEQSWEIPSYSTVYRIVQNLDRQLISMAHDGTKAYRDKFELIHRRECKRSNQIWQADHTLLDCWVLDEAGNPRRPWLTVILDDFSRAVCSYYLSFEAPCSYRTALTLRQAIWRKADQRWLIAGIPDVFYTDNGSDFTSKHMEQVAADIKMRLIFSTKGMPRGRGKMERFFLTVNELFLCHQQGYIAGKEQSKAALSLPELGERFHDWVVGDYMARIHAGIKCTPNERWTKNAFLPRLPDSLEQLDLLLLTVARARFVHPDGIRFQCLRYFSTTLAAYVGEAVVIRYDPRDMAEIRVFYKNRFLCRAVCSELETETVSLQEIIRARNERRRELKREITSRNTLVSRYISVHRPEVLVLQAAQRTETSTVELKRYEND